MPLNQTSFKEGNKVAQKSPKVVLRKFNEMLENAQNDNDILCFQDACYSIGWRDSKVDYWVNKSAVFEKLKKDIQSAIIRRINKGALTGGYNPTASIWREKQLGETDSQNIDHTSKGEKITIDLSSMSTDELIKRAKAIESLGNES